MQKTSKVQLNPHPGSTAEEIANEPDWVGRHHHRIGFRNSDDRTPGLTHHIDDEEPEYKEEIEHAREDLEILSQERREGKPINFRELIDRQEDFHLRHPDNRSLGWRYVLDTTEDWVKNQEKWPANSSVKGNETSADEGADKEGQKEQSKHQKDQSNERQTQKGSEDRAPKKNYSPEKQVLLEVLQREKDYISSLKVSDGNKSAPQIEDRAARVIDEQDQFTPDNWLPRSSDLIRLTGKHPLNAEAHLSQLFAAGLITPNELHYVRNHGSVPRILWEFHKLDVEYEGNTISLSMDDLKHNYEPINIPVLLACDGNRRKEFNMIRKTKGFNWGAGAVSCAYWKGPLLRDILISAGVPRTLSPNTDGVRYWVNFAGDDELQEGRYETCIPFEYAMDPTNDVLLAYKMNDVFLPPDHGYPVRLVIPGYVGGRCVKWLKKIWITDKENTSYHHIWDNRVLPSFVTDIDDEFAKTMFSHPDTSCNEQILNSVIVRPAQGEKINFAECQKGHSYRIEGYAYDGGGHEVQRVELSLDAGATWLYCTRNFPEYPIRHGKKFWTWLHWHVDVEMTRLLGAQSITVRCFNVFKNTQPEKPIWNIMGMMNNCWYIVKTELIEGDEETNLPSVISRHPTEPGTGDGGWLKPSEEIKIAQAKQEAGTPEKQFTREEIEKHDKDNDCWIVIDGKVYDATSVIDWHPGGKAAILSHAGKVHQQTTDEFESIHDDYAYEKLKECILGSITEKAKNFIKKSAEAAAKEDVADGSEHTKLALQKHRWVPVKLIDRQEVSKDTRKYTFQVPDGKGTLGLGTCQHILIGFHLRDRMLIRSYTPIRPLLPAIQTDQDSTYESSEEQEKSDDRCSPVRDGHGTFDLMVKTYFPDPNQPGGAMSNILDCIPVGEEVEMRGPTGDIIYEGLGKFIIEGKERRFTQVSLVLGGTGVTPGFALIARILLTDGDSTQLRVLYANKTEDDILLRDELDRFAKSSERQIKITHVLSNPNERWKGYRGHVNSDMIRENLFGPAESSVVFLCGPPPMVQKAALPALRDWGYVEDQNMFGF
ncbi:hypothetical protein TWF217_002030 [Orbilia oligospora]|nr:hypothetical protein TWF217_002030 [Orbilia oligospora]KAF3242115.1 hypothetical protein TWF128_010592 [Orbilia oligospora]